MKSTDTAVVGPTEWVMPMSSAQLRLWLLAELDAGESPYNIVSALRLRGRLQPGILERCLNLVVERHEALRTTFHLGEDGPVQVVHESRPVMIVQVDLEPWPEAEREKELLRRAQAMVATPMDLIRGPLLHVVLYRLRENEHALLTVIHHIVADGWSLGVLADEVGCAYRAELQGRRPKLPVLAIQYGDFAIWQEECLAGGVREAELRYWRQQLAGLPPQLDLASDHPRPSRQRYCGHTWIVGMPGADAEAIRQLARDRDVSLYMVLLAVYAFLIGEHSGQTDIAIGSPIANRVRPELEPLIGFFVNTLVMRMRVGRARTFGELLEQAQAVALDAYDHQQLPYEQLVEALAPERNLASSPLFQVMLVLQNTSDDPLQLPGVDVSVMHIPRTSALFDLTLGVIDGRDGFIFEWEYNTDLFVSARIERMAAQFVYLLRECCRAPDANLLDLPHLPDPARSRPPLAPPRADARRWHGESVVTVFEAQARARPQAVAVSAGGESLSYRQLQAFSDCLAMRLLNAGTRPGEPIAVCAQPSAALLIAVLAVVKARGIYLPLDPSLPAERCRQMLAAAGATRVVGDAASFAELGARMGSTALAFLASEPAALSGATEVDAPWKAHPSDAMYIIFTSGSTGVPKGATVDHRGFMNLLAWYVDALDLGPTDGTLVISAFNFDLTQKNLYAPLLVGGTVHFRQGAHDPEHIVAAVARLGVTWLNCTPSTFYTLLEADPERAAGDLRSLRHVVLGGEPIAMSRLVAWLAAAETRATVMNSYGPTECTDVVAWHSAAADVTGELPLGQAIPGISLYVLDANMRDVPVGVPGELWIGGVCVGAGYVGDPRLTAERFAPDPWSSTPGARLYRSGDRVRLGDNGELEFLGRFDFGVKVRGFRVDLGEIETALHAHPQLAEAVVAARDDLGQATELVAYLVAREPDGRRPAAGAIMAYLGERVPQYMVPSYVHWLDRLPLNANGKVDRLALPRPERDKAAATDAPPSTPLEVQVASLWADVLGLSEVGLRQNFFESGGHSLLATQLAARLRKDAGLNVSMRMVFECPTVAALTERLAGEAKSVVAATRSAPQLVPRPDLIPMSFAQQRLWLVDQVEGASSVYNLPIVVRLRGRLDRDALQQALMRLAERQEALRTRFLAAEPVPAMVIEPPTAVALSVTDLRGTSWTDEGVRRLVKAETEATFDLTAAALWRIHLFQLDENEHLLASTVHHSICDGESIGIMMREFAHHYNEVRTGRGLALPPLRVHYADYALWQRDEERRGRHAEQLDFWSKQLAGIPSRLELPTDFPRPERQSSQGRLHAFAIEPALHQACVVGAAREGVSLFVFLLSAYAVLLSRYSGQSDVVVGIPAAGREGIDVADVMGFFIGALPLRLACEPTQSVAEFVRRVGATLLDALDNQAVAFDRIVRAVQPQRQASHTPVYQVMFTLAYANPEPPRLDGLEVELLAVERTTAKFDLTFSFETAGEQLHGLVEYRTELFMPQTIARMAEHYRHLLAAMCRDSNEALADLPWLSAAETRQLVVECNDTATAYPDNASVHALFAEQAAATPTAVAVVFGDERLTYAELDRRANRLAHALRAVGVAQGAFVGIYMERSVDLIVAMLGCLKAGAAYLPIDLSYPVERVRFMLADAAARVLLTRRAEFQGLPGLGADVDAVIVIDDMDWAAAPMAALDLACPAASLAYVIYTSGSSGQPKGVAVTHQAILRLVRERVYADLVAADVVAQASNAAFDAATFEIWGALLNGAKLLGIDRETSLSPSEFAAFLRREGVSVLFLTTALFNQIARECPAAYAGLRLLLFGGERVDPHLVAEVLRHGRPWRLLHVYGPTETTTFASWFPVASVPAVGATVPIGRPLANTTLYVLDPEMRPTPVNVAGELYIGGPGLARGYLNRPALTAEKFVPHPFVAGGERLYRTGDLVRRDARGDIVFIGRIDRQAKIRGLRIELGEIETALLASEGIHQAHVTLRDDAAGTRQLVAYVTGPGARREAELRENLRRRLPEYMVPAWLVALDALPLTVNGKVDRAALPVPSQTHSASADSCELTPTERELAGLWAELLEGVAPSRDANFFDYGGHSLLASQLAARLRQRVHPDVTVRDVFLWPTLAQLATRLDALRAHPVTMGEVPRRGLAQPGPAYLSFAQERMYVLSQLDPDSPAYNVYGAFLLAGALDVQALRRALRIIVERHDTLRTRFLFEHGEPRQVLDEVPEEILTVVERPAEMASRCWIAERTRDLAAAPFDLARAPLFRATLLRLSVNEHVLVLVNHHIVSDGWSSGIFVRELSLAYAAYGAGLAPALPDLPICYRDYAVWQRAWLSGARLDAELAYWRGQLYQAPPRVELHPDRARPPQQTLRGAVLDFALPAEVAAGLRQRMREEDATLYMVLLAGFVALLFRYSGQQDIVVGSPVANRDRPEIEGLIGLFVNTVVLRIEVDPKRSLRDLLRVVRRTTLDALAHQQLPFEKLVDALRPTRDISGTPLFHIMFILQDVGGEAIRLPGLAIEPLPLQLDTAKFDLTLAMRDDGGVLAGTFEYNADLFESATVGRIRDGLLAVCSALAAIPEQRVGEVSLLSSDEERQALREWNRTDIPRRDGACLHDLIEEQARRTPAALAIECGPTRLRYDELSARADQLADQLVACGAGPEIRVAVALTRRVEMVIGLLAVLKAGAAYVPLDPSYPAERIRFMLDDSAVSILLSEASVIAAFGFASRGPLVCVDIDQLPGRAPNRHDTEWMPARPANLAYVLYTSGSTGRPKGVAIAHSSPVALLDWVRTVYAPADMARVFAATSICFDLSVYELFATLASGGTVVLGSNALALAQDDSPEGLTLLNTVPSAIDELRRAKAIPASVRTINLAGEPLLPELVDALYAETLVRDVYDLYGPSEDTTYSTFIRREPHGRKSIGRPVGNTQLYLLDQEMNPVPVGIPGEVYLGGAGLARGYLNRPATTAERFVPNPFSSRPGARLYRTGDLARYFPDGAVEFIGRLDHQIKLRGYRIELGEIEAVLASHALVHSSVVLAEQRDGTTRLRAYVDGPELRESHRPELQGELATRLPAYMIPDDILILDAMPLTPNGKIDRSALLGMEVRREASDGSAPRGAAEKRLARIWANILGISDTIGVHENFFTLGGSSLMVLDMVSQIRLVFGQRLPLSAIFAAPTIAQMAAALGGDLAGGTEPLLIPIRAGDNAAPWFCIHPLGGHVLCYHDLAVALGGEAAIIGVRAVGMEAGETVPVEFAEMAAIYVAELVARQPQGAFRLIGYSFGGMVAVEIASQLHARGREVSALVLLDAPHPDVAAAAAGHADLTDLLVSLFVGLQLDAADLRLRSEDEQIDRVIDVAKKAGLVPRAMTREESHRYVFVCRANQRRWHCPARYTGPVELIRAAVGAERITADPRLGWSEQVLPDLRLSWVATDHETMLSGDGAAAVGASIRAFSVPH